MTAPQRYVAFQRASQRIAERAAKAQEREMAAVESKSLVERLRKWGARWGGAQAALLALAAWTYYDTVVPLNKLTDAEEKLVALQNKTDVVMSSLANAELALESVQVEKAAADLALAEVRSEVGDAKDKARVAAGELRKATAKISVVSNQVSIANSQLATALAAAQAARVETEHSKRVTDAYVADRNRVYANYYAKAVDLLVDEVIRCLHRDVIDLPNYTLSFSRQCFFIRARQSDRLIANLYPNEQKRLHEIFSKVSETSIDELRKLLSDLAGGNVPSTAEAAANSDLEVERRFVAYRWLTSLHYLLLEQLGGTPLPYE